MSNERNAAKTTDDLGPLWLDAKARIVARISLAVFLTILALWVARDFLAPLGWAIIIAVSAWPIYSRFSARFSVGGRKFLVPALFTAVVGLLIFLPVGLALHRASQDGAAVADALSRYRETGIPVPGWLTEIPVIGQHASNWWRTNLSDAKMVHQWIGSGAANSTDAARAMGIEVLHRTFLFVFALSALFGLLRHGPWIVGRVMDTADKILGGPGERLTFKMVEAIRGTVNGTVVVAVIEGAVIGLAYVFADVPYPLLLTLLTMAFAMLPFGAWAVFATASLLLVVQGGSPYAALGVFLFGATIMLIGDTFLWPAMVGNAARLPFVIALIGIFGGLQSFGLIGLFVGPIVMAALMIVWREWLIGSTST